MRIGLLLLFAVAAWSQDITELHKKRQQLDATVWQREIEAQRHEKFFVWLWDELRAKDAYRVLPDVPFQELRLPLRARFLDTGHGYEIATGQGRRDIPKADWPALLAAWKKRGYRLVQSEWHHASFEGTKSAIRMVLHIEHPGGRFIVRGILSVTWNKGRVPITIDATVGLEILRRAHAPAFQSKPLPVQSAKHPGLIVFDFDRDGRMEIVVPSANVVVDGAGKQRELCPGLGEATKVSLVADLDNNGHVDLIAGAANEPLRLYRGGAGGRFAGPARALTKTPLQDPSSVTVGDIDGDGDLDLFVAQYKLPYLDGSMPTPFFDANDGYPAYLLRNDGNGNYTDITEAAGLAGKRRRRTYSSSLVDLDDDGDLDLLVVSDFAGTDLYTNDGKGRFTDITKSMAETKTFGMAHVFSDFDGDGALDFYVAGMASTTARRLDRMNLNRADFPDHRAMRTRMGYGNRMYLRRGDGFAEPGFKRQVARSGWSWGMAACDFDNDGDDDLYIANGHRSGKTAKDYCTRFWCHDIYDGKSKGTPALQRLFEETTGRQLSGGMSWNGFEHNHLLWNNGGRGFRNAAFLFGVAYEEDSRSVVGEDLDGDGRPDLVVVVRDGSRFAVRIAHNKIAGGHWIGVRVHGNAIGATIAIPGRKQAIVTGTSFTSQRSFSRTFGLGPATSVPWLEVRWPDGRSKRIERPGIDRYHVVAPGP